MSPARLVPVVFVMACHSAGAPVASPRPEQACAPALPLLARQHTPNTTRIYLARLTVSPERIDLGTPWLATSKQGYVNQPAFSPDGDGLYFTWRPVGSQADIWFRDLWSGEEHPVTCTSEEEYIGSPTADHSELSVVRVGRDLSRTLAVLGLDGKPRRTLFPSLTSVGAYRWADDHTVAMFVTEPDGASRLVLGDVATGEVVPVAERVGAALAVMPGKRAVSYVDNSDEHQTTLMAIDVATHRTTKLLALPEGVDSVAWLADGSMLAGTGTRILRASAAAPSWRAVVDLAGKIDGAITRVLVSDNQRRIAIVVRIDPPSP